MAKLEEFLKANQAALTANPSGKAPTSRSTVEFDVVILEATDVALTIGHLGAKFAVDRNAVLDVAGPAGHVANPFGRGVPARITVEGETLLRIEEVIEAKRLIDGLPFTIARPSMVRPTTFIRPTPAEADWLRELARVFPRVADAPPSQPTLTEVPTVTRCDTTTGDAGVDDSTPCDAQVDSNKVDDPPPTGADPIIMVIRWT